jgi:ATP-dependent protease ClpP protease subunit
MITERKQFAMNLKHKYGHYKIDNLIASHLDNSKFDISVELNSPKGEVEKWQIIYNNIFHIFNII